MGLSRSWWFVRVEECHQRQLLAREFLDANESSLLAFGAEVDRFAGELFVASFPVQGKGQGATGRIVLG